MALMSIKAPSTMPDNICVSICTTQGLTAPSDPPGAEPSAPASQKMVGGRPLHFMSLPVHNVLHRTKIRTLTGVCPQLSEGPVDPWHDLGA